VLILLPPSEAKQPGGVGASLEELGLLSSSEPLAAARRKVLAAVARTSRRNTARVRANLKLPPGSAVEDLADNAAVLSAPTMPALERFTGVLFAALDPASLSAGERRRAGASLLVFSGAFGVLRPDEPVPRHRVPASATLPAVGGLAAYWRKALRRPMSARLEDEPLVVDLRSSDYAAMWQPTAEEAPRVVPVRVLEDRDGTLRPVSWSAKHGKGLLARALVQDPKPRRPVATVEDVAAVASRLGYRPQCRDLPAGRTGLDLVVPAP
jgi:cytoplasmic iron level regulating protein YaaA (DUF328/UPF0246 family)